MSDAAPSEEPFDPSREPLEAPAARPERPLWPGVVAWMIVCAAYLALDWGGVADGLALPVPLIAALVAARVVDRRPCARRLARLASFVVVLVGLPLGVILWWARPRLLHGAAPVTLATIVMTMAVAITLSLARRARALLLRPHGLDPDSAVHVVAVIAAITTIVISTVAFLELQTDVGEQITFYPTDSVVSVLSDGALALAGIGLFVTRSRREAQVRLDLRPLRPRHVAAAAALAAVFLVGVDLMERAESAWLPEIHAREDRFDYEFVGVSPFVGALLVSLAAGVGEELVFRGALQPRLGVVVTSLLFAAVHVQYQIPGMVMIFLVALGLGLVKERTSTTFTICVHVFYDIGAFLIPG